MSSRSRWTTRRRTAAQIEVFAREVVASDKPGPRTCRGWCTCRAGRARRRTGRWAGTRWLDRALREYRVLLLDQRGTGRSTPASRQTLAALGSPQAQAEYLAHFRADAIVADAELIRAQVTGGAPVEPAGAELRRLLHGGLPVAGAGRACARRSWPAGCPACRPPPTTCTG